MDINILVSVVIPVFNEEKNLPILYNELKEVLSQEINSYEIIFVDDGSTDRSNPIIKDIIARDKNVKGISLNRNYGQTAALVAGIDSSRGEFILTLDADLQNDPKDIIPLVAKINEGYDLVSGWRRKRKDPFLNRQLPSIIANCLISRISGLNLHDYGCTLKIYKKDFLKNIKLYGEMHRFIPLYVHAMGGKVTEIEVNHRERRYGFSKYNIKRTPNVIFDLITVKFLLGDYSTNPLYFFGRWGFLLMASGIFCGTIAFIQKIIWGIWVHKNPVLLFAIFFILMGTQIIFMGLIAELCMRIYYETSGRLIYKVKENINS